MLSLVLGVAIQSKAAKHELIVGTFGPKSLYTLEFDDDTFTLELVATTETTTPNGWISLSHDKKNLYATAWQERPPYFMSFSIENATHIIQDAIVHAGGECNGTSTYVAQVPTPPYAVYGCFFYNSSGCGTVMSVDGQGRLDGVGQNYTFMPESAVHGTAFSADSKLLYSADLTGNAIWTHFIDQETGTVTWANITYAPQQTSHPRHVSVHPSGKFLYVLMEGSSTLAQYSIDPVNGFPIFMNDYPLLLDGEDPVDFWADEVALSQSGKYLWATNRARDASRKGYISAFELDGTTGYILKQKFLMHTASSGGYANSVAPSPFSDRFVALTDSQERFVEIWILNPDASSAGIVAHLPLPYGDPPAASCCANAVWYS